MTVQELIDKLNDIPDKSLKVVFISDADVSNAKMLDNIARMINNIEDQHILKSNPL